AGFFDRRTAAFCSRATDRDTRTSRSRSALHPLHRRFVQPTRDARAVRSQTLCGAPDVQFARYRDLSIVNSSSALHIKFHTFMWDFSSLADFNESEQQWLP